MAVVFIVIVGLTIATYIAATEANDLIAPIWRALG
jgi:hypothetical protein